MSKKWVFLFEEVNEVEKERGSWNAVRLLLGGKGANLAKMASLGISVPPGFTISTEACNEYYKVNEKFPEGMWDQTMVALKHIEEKTGKKVGDTVNPLLVSCRSGAAQSMPGMMDTVLNIGLNDVTAQAMIKLTNNERFVYDSYRRLVQGYACIVLGLKDEIFEKPLEEYKKEKNMKFDNELTAEDWKVMTEKFKKIVIDHGKEFPQDPIEQIRLSIHAVFASWNSDRAKVYRKKANIPDDLGTAVNIVTMVFGNMGEKDSGTGVAFTRNPSTGEKALYGEFLFNAQGEDVVAGIRNTDPIVSLETKIPEAYKKFIEESQRLEKYFTEMQDIEFTVERGVLYFLQTRDGKRTARAKVKIAVDLVEEGLITKEKAILRVSPDDVDTLLHPQFNEKSQEEARKSGKLFAKGVAASPGAAVGRIYFEADTCEKKVKEENQDVIMVRTFTKPDDVHGMLVSKGIFTNQGGATSHAAVVARQFGIPCVVGASATIIDQENKTVRVGDILLKEGDWVSVDGTTGEIFACKLETIKPDLTKQVELTKLLSWADEICAKEGMRSGENMPSKGLQVWANADYPADAKRARMFGAKGIGLCRTEHMFLGDRSLILRKFILAKEEKEKQNALAELQALQTKDFEELFVEMTGLPVIVRLIDPPLHEFLPTLTDLIEEVSTLRAKGVEDKDKENLLTNVKEMHESNPMLGLRGVRLSIVKPELVQMQITAVFEGACQAKKRGFEPIPEIMIPLVSHIAELKQIQPELEKVAAEVLKKYELDIKYKFGTMIETPRAALTGGEIAHLAEFFSFGTNDLTQMTFGYSRDDAESGFLMRYLQLGVLPENPFKSIDTDGVGKLIRMCVTEGRTQRPGMDIGICGEHGGEPRSIKFASDVGLTYVSCSPFRIPIARLSACHALLK
ncbi:pyruvate phosphate dikinase 1 [Anaeramoeba ignava]|uniref:Pyruvate, phosphate dikinase n=1 Tax=Anaeramoeba ignava TaxID=1746090 RepID=A0A9Q0R747_ANAIG|nr:pyruvate phosphate dikinase 1 [Anaeramoeba ignava]